MNDDINKDLGIVTAYAYAVSKGYTGTEDDFAALMADYAEVGERAEAAATAAAASATAASGSASDSAASATAAAGSSTAASTAAGNASQAATTATTKASEAAQSATAAAGSATTASTKATEAAQSATAAAGSATTAGASATAAQTAQTAAETAQTAAETAQEAAEDAAESVSASAAQIAQNTADISSVESQIDSFTTEHIGANINGATYEHGYISSNGTDTTAQAYESVSFRTKDYIPVEGGKSIYWWGYLTDGTTLGAIAVVVEYDSTRTLIGGVSHTFNKYGSSWDNQKFTLSNNAKYIRFALYQGVADLSTINIAVYYEENVKAYYVPYSKTYTVNYDAIYTQEGESIVNIGLTPIYEHQEITVQGESGALRHDGTVTQTTDVTRYKIPVIKGEKYVVTARHGYAYRAFLVLDADNHVLSYFPTGVSGTEIHRNVEVNINEDGYLVVQDVYNFMPYIGKAVGRERNDKLYQKSIYWNGDSICYGASGFSFANQISLIHAMPETMDAVSGTRLSTRSGFTNSIYERVTGMDTTADYDYIGIEGGYNDYFSSVAIGTLTANYTDSPDTTTVIGAVEGICKHIRTNFPNSKFFFVLGHRPIAVGAYPTEVDTYWDAIISALEKWAVPYVDIRKEGTLMAYNADWLADYFGEGETMGTHPNTEGYTKFYNPMVENIMKSL